MVLLLRQQVVLLAMKDRRAPMPVSATLWKGLLRRGILNDLDDLGSVARRLSFLGDERMLLAELRIRTSTNPPVQGTLSKDGETVAEDRPLIEDGRKCQ